MKSRRRFFLINALVIAIILLAVGFAIFTDALGITGTATTTGTFDIAFISAITTNTVGSTPTAVITPDGKTLTISANDLAYPGAGTDVNVTVRNLGNIPALLRTVTTTGTNDPDISVTITNMPTNEVMVPNEQRTFTITIKWNPVSETGDKSITFTVNLLYEQYTP